MDETIDSGGTVFRLETSGLVVIVYGNRKKYIN